MHFKSCQSEKQVVEFRLNKDISRMSFQLYCFLCRYVENENGDFDRKIEHVYTPEVVEAVPGCKSMPLISVDFQDDDQLQKLFDDMWEAGFRPENTSELKDIVKEILNGKA